MCPIRTAQRPVLVADRSLHLPVPAVRHKISKFSIRPVLSPAAGHPTRSQRRAQASLSPGVSSATLIDAAAGDQCYRKALLLPRARSPTRWPVCAKGLPPRPLDIRSPRADSLRAR
ncbi:hypothetical protein PsYK624_057790 [Phanerochaete sordida]|uniref:Uncharacterized protein n=1 Tax=Phanerochaete sordida TaxID=48140 RepID=A0A9P3G5N3_9APHY|nr:hypothetical protein PsYK624_057790 [Phanerochaete sordida]